MVDIPPVHRPTTAQPQYSCFLPRLRPSDPVSTTLPFWSSPRCHQHESYYHCHLLRPPLRHPIATAVSARRSPGRASSSTRTASGISYPSAVSLSPLLRACMRAAVLHPAPAIPPARVTDLSATTRPMTCHVPAALPSSPMRGLRRRCGILRACAAAG